MKVNRNIILLLIVLFSALLLPFAKVPLFWLSILIVLFSNILLSAGFNLFSGYSGYFNFGFIIFWGLGAYASAILQQNNVPTLIAAPLAALAVLGIALFIGYGSLRIKGVFFAIFMFILIYVCQLIMLVLPFTGGPYGLMLPVHLLDPWLRETIFYEANLILVVAIILATKVLSTSKLGIGLACIRLDEVKAETLGIATPRYKTIAFAISALFLGIGGALYAQYTSYIDPYSMFNLVICFQAIAATLIGGKGTIAGPVIGAVILTSMLQGFRYVMGTSFQSLPMIIYSLILVIIILVSPGGIITKIKKFIFPKKNSDSVSETKPEED